MDRDRDTVTDKGRDTVTDRGRDRDTVAVRNKYRDRDTATDGDTVTDRDTVPDRDPVTDKDRPLSQTGTGNCHRQGQDTVMDSYRDTFKNMERDTDLDGQLQQTTFNKIRVLKALS
jgi:hypothetical protein